MSKTLANLIKVGLTVIVASVLLTVMVDALEKPDGQSLKFWQSSDDGPCPEGMVPVIGAENDFCIDQYEASPGRKCDIQTVSGQPHTQANMDFRDCEPESAPNKSPWTHVTKTQAQALCARAGKRLPTASEWYYAALGTPDLDSNWQTNDCQVDKNWATQPGLTGQASECRSGAGAFDMIGNVWEWVNESVVDGQLNGLELPDQGYIEAVDDQGQPFSTLSNPVAEMENDYMWLKRSGMRQVARGGYFDNAEEAGVNAWYIVNESTFSGVGVGFRCVK